MQVEDFLRVTMCCPVVQGYGMTESCAVSFVGLPNSMVSLCVLLCKRFATREAVRYYSGRMLHTHVRCLLLQIASCDPCFRASHAPCNRASFTHDVGLLPTESCAVSFVGAPQYDIELMGTESPLTQVVHMLGASCIKVQAVLHVTGL